MPLFLCAQMIQIGDTIIPVTLKSQHDKEYSLVKDGMWIITWDKETTAIANEYFENAPLAENVNLLVDVSQIPSGILNLFVLPRMKKYRHPILLSYDEAYNVTLPYQEENLTLLSVKNGILTKIEYVKNQEELEKLLK
jgi:hypothetical protein